MILGEDAESSRLDSSTWIDPKVGLILILARVYIASGNFLSCYSVLHYGSCIHLLHSGGQVGIEVLYSVASL